MYEDREAKIVNNCNVQILLGAASNDDCQYFSDLMGQTTVRSESASVDHKGLIQGVSGTNISDGAQLLMRPEDIRTMSKDKCLVIVNTTKPLIDEKYSSLDHPRWGESFSSFDANSQKNEFQFQRLFYVEQDESNRVVTILSSIGQTPAIGQNDNKMPKHEPIKGKRPDEQENRIGIDPNPGLSQEERQRRYEEAKRKMAAANEAIENKSASENIETNLKDKANSYGEVNIADVTGYGVDLSKLLIEVTSGSGEWEVADGDTPGTKRIQPTNDNAIANALKKGNVKKEQIHTDPNDVFDLW